ncbi:zinc finger MYM-type protein 1 [Artemisia annua]|uniref:Zinc finger MYM-type protein 1 n=1 Tax=Artemisia annua TaxID=35608 RepID=A0A2U1NYH7_ARTAN|nr:zinc finger MYM-type protein 1 [Artemisia annua]
MTMEMDMGMGHCPRPIIWRGTKIVKAQLGPKRDKSIEKGPKDKSSRQFSATYYTRILPNNEKCDREWLVYLKELDKVFCFCCELLRKGIAKGQLDNEGFSDWKHLGTRLKEHELGLEHVTNMAKWFEMRERVKKNETIDKVAQEQFEKERDHWINVILRIISVVKFLSKHNLAFRGTNEKLYKKSNGNFLGLIEMLQEFDPVIKEHVRRITRDDMHVHYLGHTIQNELILLLAHEIKSEIIKKVKQAKYFSVILDCTPDTSHQEQMSLILRYVNVSSTCVSTEESFLGFPNVDETTGKRLFDITQDELKSLDLDIDDVCGQGYDNGSNMKGRDFFGIIQCIYIIFANSSKRWQILKNNVKGLIVKPLSITRWESRVESVKAIRFQISDIREALLQVAESDNDSLIQSQAKSLATNDLGDFEFLVAIVIWFEILYVVNLEFRETGLSTAINDAKEIAVEMDVDPLFVQKRVIHRKGNLTRIQLIMMLHYLRRSPSIIFYTLLISKLEVELKNGERSDIDANELFMELRLLNHFLPSENMSPIDVLTFLKQQDCFPNALIAYRVLLTIPVTVASAERSFSKLKLLKSYLRSSMSQERLNGLAMIAIENDLLDNVDYKKLVKNFALKNARRIALFSQ